ncbi:MAG: hypothetical protein QM747_09245 [Nocardioides sp.]
MRAVQRWGVAGVATALVVLVPYAGRLRPVSDPGVATATLVADARGPVEGGYSGQVEVDGGVGLPLADHFTDLANLFGGTTRLAVWWRSDEEWRVDRLLPTGEVDLFHLGHNTTEWDYERNEARFSADPRIRLPRDADLLPSEVAQRALDGVPTSAVTRLPARRVAGVDAAGIRVPVSDPRSSLRHVDLWVDPTTGVTLAARVYGEASQPAVSSTFTTFSHEAPGPDVTRFRHGPGVRAFTDNVIDIADAADQFAPVRTPSTLAGLTRAAGTSAGLYGDGLTRLLVIPLPYREGSELSDQLTVSGAQRVQGTRLLRVGPLGVVVTGAAARFGIRWLLGGTVTDATLLQAAREVERESILR